MPAGRPANWTEDEYQLLEYFFREGLTNTQLVEALGKSDRSISTALRRRGLKRTTQNCLNCGKDIRFLAQKEGKPRLYCKPSCGLAYRKGHSPEQVRAVARGALKTAPQSSVCRVCGRIMSPEEIQRRLSKKLSIEYCSGVCYSERDRSEK